MATAEIVIGEGSMKIKLSLATAAALLAAAGAPGMAAADDNSTPAVFVTKNNTWSFEVVPYAWLPGLKGDIDVRNYNVGIDQSFSDIFKTVKFASDVLGIARYQNWVIYTQVDYFSLSTTKLENPPARGSLDSKETFYTAAAGYRFNGWASGQTFDVLAGAQGLNIDNTLTLYGLGRVEKTRSVVDGVFVLRPSFQFTQHWLFNPTISVGAGDNNYTYQLQRTSHRVWRKLLGRQGLLPCCVPPVRFSRWGLWECSSCLSARRFSFCTHCSASFFDADGTIVD
jgi:hypothetical protein